MHMMEQIASRYRRAGKLEEARAAFQRVLQDEPNNVNVRVSLGDVCFQLHDFAAAREHLRRACDIEPGHFVAVARLAELCQSLGDFDEAGDCFRRAMSLRPERAAKCLFSIAQFTRFSAHDEDVHAMERLFDSAQPGGADRMLLAFSLGKVHDDIGSYRQAFGYFAEGNRIAGETYPFAPGTLDYRGLTETFDAAFVQRHANEALADATPVFITGMPRSGSTLVEQIISSHSRVHGGGECLALQQIVKDSKGGAAAPFHQTLANAEPGVLRGIATRYVDELAALAAGEPRVTDKSLSTPLYIGLINAILPRAKIIYCSRDLRDQGLSCFQKYFGEHQVFSYDLVNMARFFRARIDLMQRWTQEFPGRIYSLCYEDLVADPETWTRALLESCELDFEPQCLQFHTTRRAVATSSLEQVRRPVYTSSLGRWRHYESGLAPLIDELGPLADQRMTSGLI